MASENVINLPQSLSRNVSFQKLGNSHHFTIVDFRDLSTILDRSDRELNSKMKLAAELAANITHKTELPTSLNSCLCRFNRTILNV